MEVRSDAPAEQIYEQCRIFTGMSDEVIDDAALAVNRGRVAWVGRRAALPTHLAQGAHAVDLGGAFVMPGMIDAHTHLAIPLKGKSDLPLSYFEYVEYTALKAAYNALAYLAAGFTSVMDVGCRGNVAVALRDAIETGVALGPRIVASGPQISPTAGLADDFLGFVHNDIVHGVVADTPDQLRVAVRTQVKEGVDNVKIGVSGSAFKRTTNPYVCDMDAEAIATVVQEARRAGCSVAAHVQPASGFLDCLRAGVDTVHHGYFIDQTCVEPFDQAKNTYFVPTIWKLTGTLEGSAAAGRAPEIMRAYKESIEAFSKIVSEFIRYGLSDRIAVGSDAGHVIDHGGTAREVSLLVDLGMTPTQALRSATSVAARAIKRERVVGSLSAGLAADFIAIDGDPLADIRVLEDRQKLVGVYQNGVLTASRGSMVQHLNVSRPFPAIATSGRRRRGRLDEN